MEWRGVPVWLIAGYSSLKAFLLAVVVLVIGTTFVQSVIVAVVSGALGVVGMVIAAWIAAQTAARQEGVLHEIRDTTTAVAEAVTPDPEPDAPHRRKTDFPKLPGGSV